MKWEHFDRYYRRAKVEGGWLVEYFNDDASRHPSNRGRLIPPIVSITFVPDPLELWEPKESTYPF